MAAPASKTTKDLRGTWILNKGLSDSADLGLTIQGIGYFIRGLISVASITVIVSQYEAPPKSPSTDSRDVVHIDIDQVVPGVSPSRELRCLDDLPRAHTDWLFGESGWLSEEEGKSLIYTRAISEDKGWTATQVWGFQDVNGERHHCHNFVIQKEEQRAEFRFVYDWQEPSGLTDKSWESAI
ncbi:hypothetical protein IFM51744_09889 [Aspergillus udagawae]|uniref:Uncharacterized protein n=1 Tax=Aspergillus udagawae TaxID=91492 RepID=A0ABQ1AZM8_9EURO|nr:hypothetical protein IFM51744_09889 [Aspergillus udagawae]GFF90981.1 hypothetical protein IFM53868_06350 [Aspergillus udagawae]